MEGDNWTFILGLKKRTRKAFGIRKKEKDNDSTGSPDREGGSQKKTNGTPNGFYGDIDWDRYKPHFFSSDESEEEEDHRKKFKIKIKPLPADRVVAVPSFDELKASIGNIALSPSPLGLKRNTSSEEIARPRRVVPTVPTVAPAPAPAPQPPSSQETPVSEDTTALFGPPLETAFGEQKTEVVLSESDVWGTPLSEPESSLTRSFPTGKVSPEADDSTRKSSIANLDNIFGPEQAPPAEEDASDTWVCFTEESSDQPPLPKDPAPPLPTSPPPPEEPAPPLPASPPPPESPAPPLPTSPPPPEDPAPPPPISPPLKEAPVPPLPTSPPPSEECAPPCVPSGPPTPEEQNPVATSPPPAPKELASPPTSSPPPPLDSPASIPTAPTPKASTPPLVTPPAEEPATCSVPPPLVLSQEEKPKNTDASQPKEDEGETVSSPKDASQGSRTTPPPPPPPTYRAVVLSPGPTSGASGTNSGCSRGPSPLTMGAQDTLPVAAAFTETVNAFFKGADPSKCVVKIIGEMVLSFPAGITRHFANNPSPAVLTFSITNYSRLEHVLPNPQLLCCDTTTQAKADAKDFWVNMPNLISHLKKVAEQKPQATYYNVDMLKYQVSVQGLHSTPLNLAVSWRCEPTSTDLRIDYKYNGEAMTTPMALNNVQFLVPVDGGVSKLQAVLPPAAWTDVSYHICSRVGSLLARFQLTEGPSKPAPLAVQFTSEGSTLSGCDIELAGPGYRFSLVKKRFAAGKYLADN
eukprot:superscaffoldBa00000256_g3244